MTPGRGVGISSLGGQSVPRNVVLPRSGYFRNLARKCNVSHDSGNYDGVTLAAGPDSLLGELGQSHDFPLIATLVGDPDSISPPQTV